VQGAGTVARSGNPGRRRAGEIGRRLSGNGVAPAVGVRGAGPASQGGGLEGPASWWVGAGAVWADSGREGEHRWWRRSGRGGLGRRRRSGLGRRCLLVAEGRASSGDKVARGEVGHDGLEVGFPFPIFSLDRSLYR
jgi:hypothetical protein